MAKLAHFNNFLAQRNIISVCFIYTPWHKAWITVPVWLSHVIITNVWNRDLSWVRLFWCQKEVKVICSYCFFFSFICLFFNSFTTFLIAFYYRFVWCIVFVSLSLFVYFVVCPGCGYSMTSRSFNCTLSIFRQNK